MRTQPAKDMDNTEEQLRGRLIEASNKSMDKIERYLGGGAFDKRVDLSFKVIQQGVKILHMNQHRELTKSGQAIRLLKFLPNEKVRQEYIRLTNPQVAPLMLDRPTTE